MTLREAMTLLCAAGEEVAIALPSCDRFDEAAEVVHRWMEFVELCQEREAAQMALDFDRFMKAVKDVRGAHRAAISEEGES